MSNPSFSSCFTLWPFAVVIYACYSITGTTSNIPFVSADLTLIIYTSSSSPIKCFSFGFVSWSLLKFCIIHKAS